MILYLIGISKGFEQILVEHHIMHMIHRHRNVYNLRLKKRVEYYHKYKPNLKSQTF